MLKSQCAFLCEARTWKPRILLRQQGVLKLARCLQVLFELGVLLAQFLRISRQLLLSELAGRDVSRRLYKTDYRAGIVAQRHLAHRHPGPFARAVNRFRLASNDRLAGLDDLKVFGMKV